MNGASLFTPAPSLSQLDSYFISQNISLSNPCLNDVFDSQFIENITNDDTNAELKTIYQKVSANERISAPEALLLLNNASTTVLGYLANRVRKRIIPQQKASFLIDRNINYSNVCIIGCDFCAFYKPPQDFSGYVLSYDAIFDKIAETISLGGTGILLQGGVNPALPITWYESLFSEIKNKFNIHIHALSTIEIFHIAKMSQLTVADTLIRLKKAGLDSIPGAGAEILADDVRQMQSPNKQHATKWLEVMQVAHELNMATTATMMFGALDNSSHIIEHLHKIRTLQDKTHGFYAFIPWTFQSENTKLKQKYPELMRTVSATEYLRVIAVARIFLDNIINIQGSCVTMGPNVGQMSLSFGANDIGSIMIEENVVAAAGTINTGHALTHANLIRGAGFTPFQRDTYYRLVKNW